MSVLASSVPSSIATAQVAVAAFLLASLMTALAARLLRPDEIQGGGTTRCSTRKMLKSPNHSGRTREARGGLGHQAWPKGNALRGIIYHLLVAGAHNLAFMAILGVLEAQDLENKIKVFLSLSQRAL